MSFNKTCFVRRLVENTNNKDEFLNIVEEIPLSEWWDTMKAYRDKVHSMQKKKYYYLVTFTLRPDIGEEGIEDYIISQFENRIPMQVEKAYIVKEYTKKQKTHWHVSVCTNKFLKKNMFNYYVRKYGFVDIRKSRLNSIEESLNYISKVDTPKELVISYT